MYAPLWVQGMVVVTKSFNVLCVFRQYRVSLPYRVPIPGVNDCSALLLPLLLLYTYTRLIAIYSQE